MPANRPIPDASASHRSRQNRSASPPNLSEMKVPDPIGHYPRGQRVVRIDQPFGEFQSPLRFWSIRRQTKPGR
jgi:hypothetical protein